jgi:hypothetical protein
MAEERAAVSTQRNVDDYQIVLPCDPKDFRDFVSGLLGKPQTIARGFLGPFDITRSDIENFYHLIDQRVQQQNEATLISFTATIVYDDRSSVQLNSLADFMAYNEVRPLISHAVHLSWGFLVKFRDKKVPEKQQIDVSISTDSFAQFDEPGPYVIRDFNSFGKISLRVEHTARTWGADIESLLSGHIQTLVKKVPAVAAFLNRQAEWIGLGAGASFFLGCVVSTFIATGKFLHHRLEIAAGLARLDPSTSEATSKKVDYLIDVMASGMWPRYFFYVACFLFGAVIVSILLGLWAGSTAGKTPSSFLLLSKQAEERKKLLLKEKKRYWLLFAASLAMNLFGGIAANWIFVRYFQSWVSH